MRKVFNEDIPAFPFVEDNGTLILKQIPENESEEKGECYGLTKYEYFKAKATQGLLSNPDVYKSLLINENEIDGIRLRSLVEQALECML